MSKQKLVYNFGSRYGFFSEYNNMILCYIYCLEKGIGFSLFDSNARFSERHDWLEFFQPFCPHISKPFHARYNRRDHFGDMSYAQILKDLFSGKPAGEKELPPIKRLEYRFMGEIYKAAFKFDLYTYELFAKARFERPDGASIALPEYDVDGDVQHACCQLIKHTWKYNEKTKLEVSAIANTLTLPENYLGFHIRGGDKFSEYELQAVDQYVELAKNRSSLKSAFVLTDDFSVVETLHKQYPDWEFYTLCGEDERGYFHEEFLKKSKAEVRASHVKLFASMDILAGSELFVGTFSSNPGMYLGMRMPKGKTVGIDFEKWFIW